MRYAGVLFDKDGTLLDFNRTWLPIYLAAAAEFADGDERLAASLLADHGFDAKSERFIGGSLLAAGNNAQIAAAWAQQLGASDRVEELAARVAEIFRLQCAVHATPVDGLALTLRRLKQAGVRLGVATADSHAGIVNSLQAFDVLEEFDFLAGFDSGFGVKSDRGMVLAFCRATDLDPGSVAVVGDNRHDIEMGRNAGAGLCVGVLTGTSSRAELEAVADLVLDDIGSLPEHL